MKKEENWSDEFYQKQLKTNLKNNGIEEYYINQIRFDRLKNILKKIIKQT